MDPRAEADFEAFVLVSGNSLLRTALLMTGDLGHAEDVTQTALERVAARWSRLAGNPEAYARRCIVNASRDRWRSARSRPVEVAIEAGLGTAVDDATSQLGLRDALVSALQTLPHRQRATLTLRYFLDLDEAATAEAMGVSVGAVKSAASRALATLRLSAVELHLTDSPTRQESPS